MPYDSAQFWRRDKPTRAHGPWFQQQDTPFWELKQAHNPNPAFETLGQLEAARNPFHHSDRYSGGESSSAATLASRSVAAGLNR